MYHDSLWRSTSRIASRTATLPREVEVLVVGAGITGLTAAYLLARSGKRVAVVERERVGSGETGNTSAHLTQITDLRLTTLADRFGRDAARLVWEGGGVAIDLVESIVEREGIECGFARVPGWLCSPFFESTDDGRALREDAELALEIGIQASYHSSGAGRWPTCRGVRRPGARASVAVPRGSRRGGGDRGRDDHRTRRSE